MKILYMTTGCFDKGGISRYSRYQVTALRELFGAGNVNVFSLLGPTQYGFEVPFNVAWQGSLGKTRDKIEMSARASIFALTAQPNVIHVAHVNLAPLAIKLGQLCGAKTVLNVYGLEVWSGLSPRRRAAMAAMDRIVADCHFTAGYVVQEQMWREKPTVIWDCVDLERFKPGICPSPVLSRYGLPDKHSRFVVLTLGRLAKGAAHKGYDRLILAFAKLRQFDVNAHLVIAGQGDDRPRLESLVADHDLGAYVTFTGPIREEDLADVYRSASIFSLISDRGPGRGEGIPLTPLEAMSCGLPILVGNQDGSQEAVVVRQGVANGYVLDPFNIESLAAAIGELASSAELLGAMAANARPVAEEMFGFQRFVDQHTVLYSSLVRVSQKASARC